MKLILSLSALKPSQYREFVKEWDRNRYKDIFKKYTDDPKAFRIYLPLANSTKAVKAPAPLLRHITTKGYVIDDYVAGYAVDKKDPKRRVRIGKLLTDETLKKKFASDPQRQANRGKMMVVISRHPYDIAGMSTDRGWTSCQDLVDGELAEYVGTEIKAGSLVAYLVDEKDPDIKKPKSRLLLKRFLVKQTWEEIFVVSHIYGAPNAGFKRSVDLWVAKINKPVLAKIDRSTTAVPKEGVYDDRLPAVTLMGPAFKKQIKEEAQSWTSMASIIGQKVNIGFDSELVGKSLQEVMTDPELATSFFDPQRLSSSILKLFLKEVSKAIRQEMVYTFIGSSTTIEELEKRSSELQEHIEFGTVAVALDYKEITARLTKFPLVVVLCALMSDQYILATRKYKVLDYRKIQKAYYEQLASKPEDALIKVPAINTGRRRSPGERYTLGYRILRGLQNRISNAERNKIFKALLLAVDKKFLKEDVDEKAEDLLSYEGLNAANTKLLNLRLHGKPRQIKAKPDIADQLVEEGVVTDKRYIEGIYLVDSKNPRNDSILLATYDDLDEEYMVNAAMVEKKTGLVRDISWNPDEIFDTKAKLNEWLKENTKGEYK